LAASGARAAPAWTVDPAHSRLGFDSKIGGIAFSGAFRKWDASIAFDPEDLAHSTAAVAIDLASAATGDKDRDGLLPAADWFDTAHFPQARFATSTIKSVGPGRYLASGQLTLKGVTRPVSLPFTVTIQGRTATMTGAVAIDRSLFNVGAAQFSGEDVVPHAVTVRIAIVARRK